MLLASEKEQEKKDNRWETQEQDVLILSLNFFH